MMTVTLALCLQQQQEMLNLKKSLSTMFT